MAIREHADRQAIIAGLKALYGLDDQFIDIAIERLGYSAFSTEALKIALEQQERYERRITRPDYSPDSPF